MDLISPTIDDISPKKVIFFDNHNGLFIELYKMLLKKKKPESYEITFEDMSYTFAELELLIFSLDKDTLLRYINR